MRIRVIDIETTGEAPPDHKIVELGWCDVVSTEIHEDFIEGKKRPGAWIVDGRPKSTLVNPGRPIPAEVSAIHHIVDEDVADAPSLQDVAGFVLQDPTVDAFCAHLAKFERAFIPDELTGGKPWICTYKCALRIWKDEQHHSNQALRYSRKPEGLDRNLAMVAHRAGPDAYVTAFHLRDMLNGGALVEHMITRSNQPALQVWCHIGQHRGKRWADVPTDFLSWMLGKDFDEDVMFTARHWINERTKPKTQQKDSI